MTACLRVMCVLDVAVVKPHRMFAGKADVLHEDCAEWKGCASMCDIADGIHGALKELENNKAKFLDPDFMLGIFDKWKVGNKKVEDWYRITYTDGKKSNVVGSTAKSERVFAMDQVIKVVFNSEDPAMIETDEDTLTLGLMAVVRFMEELVSTKTGKKTHQFMSCLDGKRSWKNMTLAEKEASKEASAVTDIAESHFAYSKHEKHKCGTTLSVLSAGAVAVSKTTGFMKRVLGNSVNTEELGYWHKLDSKKQDIIMVYAERKARGVRAEHKRAVEAFKKHKSLKFSLDEEGDARKAFNKYKRQLGFHSMIFTG